MVVLPGDEEILVALRGDDERMFEKLFRHYYSRLCNYAASYTGDPDEAEEVVQQSMIKIWEIRKTLEISSSLKSYLYRAVHNAALNKIRSAKVRKLYADQKSVEEPAYAEQASGRIIRTQLEAEIMNAINKLPEQCRMVFKLSRFEELKYSEIAIQLNISPKTVENHMGKALKLLRVSLKDHLPTIILLVSTFIK